MTDQQLDLEISRLVAAPRSRVWQADEVRTARDEGEMGILSVGRDGFRWIVGS
jgi:hypothetical protein